jgi:hypothetical protein
VHLAVGEGIEVRFTDTDLDGREPGGKQLRANVIDGMCQLRRPIVVE